MKYNLTIQHYKGIPLKLIERKSYQYDKAKRYAINNTNQNVWIPNKHLVDDGAIKQGENIDYVFRRARNQLRIAGLIIRM